ncbi:hypothetical protein N1851_005655 [Merluccius polli]|uniref:THAP-type domain-containing protein n=1 Tax=Merluccius polli TaxID=89951 RepID=A0AA47N5U9_MERPO|nr:hypothetical protein N1851_005655 [Merluccius polli]
MFQNQLRVFTRHQFNIKMQYLHYRELKKNKKSHECLIHIDFSENYACKLSAEIQAVHFASSGQQATLHTGILHVGGVDKHLCFTTISASKEKSPPAIWTHLSPVLDHVKTHHPSVTLVHYFSDGPCTPYRQKGNFYMLSTELFKKGFKKGTWSFFEAGHGKGAPDGVGEALKRTADRLVSEGKDIPNAKQLYDCLLNAETSIQLFYIDEETVDKAVQEMPKQLPVVPSTMRLHQIITLTPGKVIYRDISCLCSTRQTLECTCHNTQRFEFDVEPILSDTNVLQTQTTNEIKWESEDIIGQWCVIKYDDEIYPGTIVEKRLAVPYGDTVSERQNEPREPGVWDGIIREVQCCYAEMCSMHTEGHWFHEAYKPWLHKIRRTGFTITPHTKVCSRHFTKDQIRTTAKGRRFLTANAIPTLFEWNAYSNKTRAGVWERRTRPTSSPEPGPAETEEEIVDMVPMPIDHDYVLQLSFVRFDSYSPLL